MTGEAADAGRMTGEAADAGRTVDEAGAGRMTGEAAARLAELRRRVDALDDAVLAAVAARAAVVAEIAALKGAAGVALKDEARERAITARLVASRPPGLRAEVVEGLVRAVLAACYPVPVAGTRD
jgi:chorismate mutase